jgi:hypothetical protein
MAHDKELDSKSGTTKAFPVKIKTEAEATTTRVFVTRIILEDGSKPNPSRSLAKKRE